MGKGIDVAICHVVEKSWASERKERERPRSVVFCSGRIWSIDECGGVWAVSHRASKGLQKEGAREKGHKPPRALRDVLLRRTYSWLPFHLCIRIELFVLIRELWPC